MNSKCGVQSKRIIFNYRFVIWGVCSSYLTALIRYKEQLLTFYLMSYFSHLSLVMMYRGRNILVLGVLLHLETSPLFEFSHKLVRRACYPKQKENKPKQKTKKGGRNALLHLTPESKPLHHGQSSRLLQTCTTEAVVSLSTM